MIRQVLTSLRLKPGQKRDVSRLQARLHSQTAPRHAEQCAVLVINASPHLLRRRTSMAEHTCMAS